MNVGCIPICFFEEIINAGTMSLSDWIRMAGEVGLDGIEMYRPYLKTLESPALREYADEVAQAGLAVSMLTGYADLAVPPAERPRQFATLRDDIDLAVFFDAKIVRVTAGYWPADCAAREALERVAASLRGVLDYAEENGVTLALEDHPDIGLKVDDFVAILDLTADDRLKVNLDTSNTMVPGDDIVDLTRKVKDRVAHVHVSDRSADLEHQVVGEGAVPFGEIFSILKSAGYDGWLSLEAGGTKGRQGIIEGIEYTKRVWRDA